MEGKHHHRQRGKEHIAGTRRVHTAVQAIQILPQTLLRAAAALAAQHIHQYGHHGLTDGKAQINGDRRQHKQGQAQHIQRHICFKNPADFFIHRAGLLAGICRQNDISLHSNTLLNVA